MPIGVGGIRCARPHITRKDVISGDEMISDSYEPVKIYNDACFEVKAKMVKKGNV